MQSKYGETFSVSELIAELQKLPPNLPVITEGCDCYGTAGRLEELDDALYIMRATQADHDTLEAERAEIVREIEEGEARMRSRYPELR